jgi:hypothetical protein
MSYAIGCGGRKRSTVLRVGNGRFTYVLKIVDIDSPDGLAISVEPDEH